MSSSISAEARGSIDLSELLTFNVSFKNLELVLKAVLTRLDDVEGKLARKADAESADTQQRENPNWDAAIEELRSAVQEQRDIQHGFSKRCDGLEEAVDDAKATASGAQESADQALSRADDAHSRLDALLQRIDGDNLASRVSALESAVTGLEANKAGKAVEGEVAAAKKALHDHEVKLQELQSELAPLQSKLDAIRSACENVDAESKRRDDDIIKRLGGLASALASPGPNDAAALSAPAAPLQTIAPARDEALANDVHSMQQELQSLKDKVNALTGLASAAPSSGKGGSTEVTATQFAVLKATVDGLERRASAAAPQKDYDQVIRDIQQSLARLNDEVKTLGNECTKNTAECKRLDDRKANKSDLKTPPATSAIPPLATPAPIVAAADGDGTPRRIDDLQRLLANLDGRIRVLDADKAPIGTVQGLADEVAALKKQLQSTAGAGGNSQSDMNGAESGVGRAAEKAVLTEMQRQVGQIIEDNAKNMDWTKGQVLEIRATIEHIHHTKADTSLVANKAERDFVENSMEKLMREVEQVLNATNAGLIDTLDKSLNILRDMIDGKATKQDVIKLQSMIGEEQAGSVPEGLTGFKGYRCLGCNRTMEGMRQRPMGANFATFMNRLPNGAKPPGTPNSAQGTRIAGPSPPAGYIANTPQSH